MNGCQPRICSTGTQPARDAAGHCLCVDVVSRDIGMYDSCLFGCQYCYATSSFDKARRNHAAHDPQSPILVGWPPEEYNAAQDKKTEGDEPLATQPRLW